MKLKITVKTNQTPKQKPSYKDLGFGRHFTDHMFVAHYSGEGWHSASVQPYGALPIDPGASVLHYGQALFEGLKAFHQPSTGKACIFRPEFNWKRMQTGADRLCMQAPSKDLWMEGLTALLQKDRDWIPKERGNSLYIRPTLIGTEPFLGVRPSQSFCFFIILSPVGMYYAEGKKAVRIWVEKEFLRAAPGGLGFTKAAANYAGSLKAASVARDKGFAQVLWLDVKRECVEEVGTMNVFFVFDNEVVTPELSGTILEGGTRGVVIDLLRQSGKKVVERKISWNEIKEASQKGRLQEAFGTGTAAIVSPIEELASVDGSVPITGWGPVATSLFEQITAIQYGDIPDSNHWLTMID